MSNILTSQNIRKNIGEMVGQEFTPRSFALKFGYINDVMPKSERTSILSRIASELTQCRSTEDTFNSSKAKSEHAHFMTSMGIRLKVLRLEYAADGSGGPTHLYRVDGIDDKPVTRTIEGMLPNYIQIDYSKMIASIPDDVFMKEITRRFGN